MNILKSSTKEMNAIRKNLAKYLEKMDVYYSAVSIEDNRISNRKATAGKLSAARRFYNQAIQYRNQLNLSEEIWSMILAEMQMKHRDSRKQII